MTLILLLLQLGGAQAASQGLIPATPSTPASYDTRKERATLEVEAHLGVDGSLMEMPS